MSELFKEYEGVNPKDSVVAAAQVQEGSVRQLSQITGGTAVWKKIPGGSEKLSEIILHGYHARLGDYIIADRYDTYIGFPKDFFETKYVLKGSLRVPSTERR